MFSFSYPKMSLVFFKTIFLKIYSCILFYYDSYYMRVTLHSSNNFDNYLFLENNSKKHLQVDISPPNISEITIKYNNKTISTHNKRIKEFEGYFFPLNYKYVYFLFYENSSYLKTDIEIIVKKTDGTLYMKSINKTENRPLKGWYKELKNVISENNKIII